MIDAIDEAVLLRLIVMRNGLCAIDMNARERADVVATLRQVADNIERGDGQRQSLN